MILGVLSDTHGRVDAMFRAVELLRSAGAEYFIHCGDVGSEAVLDLLAPFPACFVFGNCDWDRADLERHARKLSINCLGVQGEIELAGKRLAILHGDDAKLRQAILSAQSHDYLLQGHTHIPADQRFGRTRLINPGALHRANPRTAATLNLLTDELKVIHVA